MTFLLPAFRLFVMRPLHELLKPARGQIAALDFLRSCAVLLVLGFHFAEHYLKAGGQPNALSLFPLTVYGWMGVDLFFVLSGYFIGKQLWRELERTGSVNYQRFVLRRGLRIWPLYYAVLVFVVFVLGGRGYSPESWWSDAVFLSNYFPDASVVSGGWSLSVEEQFYLLAPLLLLATMPLVASPRAYRGWLLGLFALLPLIRAFVAWRLTGDFTTLVDGDLEARNCYMPIHTRADGLVMGLFLAHLEVFDGECFKQGWSATIWPVVAAAGIFLAFRTSLRSMFNYTCYALVFGSLTWYLLARRRAWLRVLDARVFYVVSRLSFGMYLNHFYLLRPLARYGMDSVPYADANALAHHVLSFLLFVATSAGVAVLTFVLVESPFLLLREWIYSDKGGDRHGKQGRETRGCHLGDKETAVVLRVEQTVGGGVA